MSIRHVYLEDDPDSVGDGAEVMICVTHNDVAVMYSDLSVGCRYDAITESSNEHQLVPVLQYHLAKTTLSRSEMRRVSHQLGVAE